MPNVNELLEYFPLEQIGKALVPKLITDIRFRTAFTDETVLLNSKDVIDLIANKPTPPGPASKFMEIAKPTVTINSPQFGKRVYAPYGQPDPRTPSVWKGRVGLLLGGIAFGIFAIGFGAGRLTAKK